MNDWFPLKNSLKRGAKKLASQEIRVRKHITPTIFPDLICILHVVPWLFFQEYLLTYVKNSPILDFLIICKPTIKWILNVFGIPVYMKKCCILLGFCSVNICLLKIQCHSIYNGKKIILEDYSYFYTHTFSQEI